MLGVRRLDQLTDQRLEHLGDRRGKCVRLHGQSVRIQTIDARALCDKDQATDAARRRYDGMRRSMPSSSIDSWSRRQGHDPSGARPQSDRSDAC